MAIHKDSDGKYPSYAWPGGYPIYYIMDDAETMCSTCVNDSKNPIHEDGDKDGWRLEDAAVNWEDPELYCCNCNKRIESAYAEPEEI